MRPEHHDPREAVCFRVPPSFVFASNHDLLHPSAIAQKHPGISTIPVRTLRTSSDFMTRYMGIVGSWVASFLLLLASAETGDSRAASEWQAAAAMSFFYADEVSTTGRQWTVDYPPTNLMNDEFTRPGNTIDTTGDYVAPGNNYATARDKLANFALTFDVATPTELDGMYVWNYAFRRGTSGEASTTSGVNEYTIAFYDGPGGAGSRIGGVLSGSLGEVSWNVANPAESVEFPATYPNVRSVEVRVLSNHGSTAFTGMNEFGFFNGPPATIPAITSFTASARHVQRPAVATLDWEISGVIELLEISGIGDVMSRTTDGTGSVEVSPLGLQSYTLMLNGVVQKSLSVVGLPPRDKLHLYLLIGQSNMQGIGRPRSEILDQPDPRVLQYGSRNGMEATWVLADHPLVALGGGGPLTGMGVEFGKTLLASQSDPEIVIGLINHALGATRIQAWAPGAIADSNPGHINPVTGENFKLYDEAVQRVSAASDYGVIKGVLWHQGESNSMADLDSELDLYVGRLCALVDNLRNDIGIPGLPFICGKMVSASWVSEEGEVTLYTGLPFRTIVEAALESLPNHLSNTFCVDNDGLRGVEHDKIHFDAYSQRLIGQRYANAMNHFLADPHLLYLGGFFNPEELKKTKVTDPYGDPDGDEIVNFLEYAFLTDPSLPDGRLPISFALTLSDSGEENFPAITFRYRTDTEAPSYEVEVSDGLFAWAGNVEGEVPSTVPVGLGTVHGDGTVARTVSSDEPLTRDSPRKFLQVRVAFP